MFITFYHVFNFMLNFCIDDHERHFLHEFQLNKRKKKFCKENFFFPPSCYELIILLFFFFFIPVSRLSVHPSICIRYTKTKFSFSVAEFFFFFYLLRVTSRGENIHCKKKSYISEHFW